MRKGSGRLVPWVAAAAVALGAGCLSLPRPIRYSPSVPVGNLDFAFAANYSTYTMRNGLTVVLAPDAESNLVTVDMRYFVGALDEQPGKTGLAHLVEHVLFEVQPGGGPTLAAQLGAAALTYNANTSPDSTHYSSVALAPQLEVLVEVEARRMAALASSCDSLSEEMFEKERAIILQERAQRAAQETSVLQLAAAVWGPAHPLAHGVAGADVATLTRADACRFAQLHYTPGAAALVIGGAIDARTTLAMVARHFDGIARRAAPATVEVPALPHSAVLRAVQLPVDDPGVMVAFPLATYGSDERVIQDQVIELVGAELRHTIRDHPAVVGGGVRVVGSLRRAAVVVALSALNKTRNQMLLDEIYRAIDRAVVPRDEDELQYLKASAATALAADHDLMTQRGDLIGDYCQFTTNDSYHVNDINVLMRLSPDTVAAAGKRLFDRSRAQAFLIDQLPGATSTFELATSGGPPQRELPPRAPSTPEVLSSPVLQKLSKRVSVRELQLKNGLRVVLVPRQSQGFFDARIWFPGGRADDPAGRSGTAQLTAKLLDVRTWGLTSADVLALTTAIASGAVMSAFIGEHSTAFGVRGVPSMAALHLWRLHAMLESGEFDGRALAALKEGERGAGKDGQRSDTELAQRRERFELAAWTRLYGPGHPVLRTYQQDLGKISLDDLQGFRDRHYRAKDAVLVVVGGFEPQLIQREIEELWGAWPAVASMPSAPTPPMRPMPGPAYLALDRPDRQIELEVRFAARSSDTKDAAVRAVAQLLLNDRLVGLRERLAATYGVDLSYLDTWAGSFAVINGRVAPNRAAEVVREIFTELAIDRSSANELAIEVARARRKALQRALAASSSSSAIATTILEAVQNGQPIDQEQREIGAVAAVTTEQVRQLIKGDFDPARMVVSAEGPGASEALRASGAPTVEVVP